MKLIPVRALARINDGNYVKGDIFGCPEKKLKALMEAKLVSPLSDAEIKAGSKNIPAKPVAK